MKRKMPAEYVPTDAHRALVESASAFGITQAEIATQSHQRKWVLASHNLQKRSGAGTIQVPPQLVRGYIGKVFHAQPDWEGFNRAM